MSWMVILSVELSASHLVWNSFRCRREKNQIMLPTTTTAIESTIRNQLRTTKPVVMWLRCTTAPMDTRNVADNIIPNTIPAIPG